MAHFPPSPPQHGALAPPTDPRFMPGQVEIPGAAIAPLPQPAAPSGLPLATQDVTMTSGLPLVYCRGGASSVTMCPSISPTKDELQDQFHQRATQMQHDTFEHKAVQDYLCHEAGKASDRRIKNLEKQQCSTAPSSRAGPINKSRDALASRHCSDPAEQEPHQHAISGCFCGRVRTPMARKRWDKNS